MQKHIIVTGANTGIGKATALGLAREQHHVIMACRDPQKGEAAREEVSALSGNKSIDFLALDLADPASIRKFALNVNARYPRIDVLINNAGVSFQQRQQSLRGWEKTFAVNHLGTFLTTYLLLDLLKKSAPARVVTVASNVHKQAKLDLNDLFMKAHWEGFQAYARSKLCNIYFTYSLAEKLAGSGVSANCLCPGLVNSDFFRNHQQLSFSFRIVKKLIGKTPARGALTSLYLAQSADVAEMSGKFFRKCKPAKTSPVSYDREIAEALWQKSLELLELK